MSALRKVLLWLTAAAATATMAGCGFSGGANEAGSAEEPASAVGGAGVGQAADAGGGQPREAKAPDLRANQRVIIYNGSLTVRVDGVDQAAAKATGIVTGAGGFVGGDRRSSGSGSSSEATLELRVPADKFAGVVDQLARELGTEESRSINTQDVTEESLDLDARIKTQQARVDSGRRLLAQAKSLSELVMLEGELAKREADLASLEAKKRRLDDLTALSTITLTLLDREAEASGDDAAPGFLGGLKAGWAALVASLGVLLTVLGALLPWLIALGVPVLGALWLTRRLRRRPATARARPEPTTATPTE